MRILQTTQILLSLLHLLLQSLRLLYRLLQLLLHKLLKLPFPSKQPHHGLLLPPRSLLLLLLQHVQLFLQRVYLVLLLLDHLLELLKGGALLWGFLGFLKVPFQLVDFSLQFVGLEPFEVQGLFKLLFMLLG